MRKDPRIESPEHAPAATPTPPAPRRGPGVYLWAALGSLALAALYGRTALLNLTQGVVGGDGDGYQNMWNYYWTKTALLDLHTDPFYTTYLYYPIGTSLRFHTLNLTNGLLTMPFNLTLGYVPAINLLFVAALALTCLFSFLLIYDLVGSAWAAFAGAAVFTFANPRVVIFFTNGQAEKLSAEWLPLYLFFLFRALPERLTFAPAASRPPAPPRTQWAYAALATLVLLVLSLTDWQYLLYAVLITLLYFAVILLMGGSGRAKGAIFARLAAIGGAYTLLVLPTLVLPMIREALASPWLNTSYQSQLHALDLLDLLGPGLGNPGYLALALAVLGFVVGWRGGARRLGLFWAVVAVVGAVLALGPMLTVGGQTTPIPLPYTVFQQIPVLNSGRDPGRFTTVSTLAVGVLAALGLAALSARLRAWRPAANVAQGGRPALAAAAISGGFLLLTLPGFFTATGAAKADPPDWPPFYQTIGADPAPYAILELPLFSEEGRRENHFMMYQVLHQKPRFSARLARGHALDDPRIFIKQASLFQYFWMLNGSAASRQLYYPAQDFLRHTDYATQGLPILNFYNVRYIVLYKEALVGDWDEEAFQAVIGQVLGPGVQPIVDDRLMRVYAVPQAAPPANPLTLDVGQGWYASEQRPDGLVYRWADTTQLSPPTVITMNLAAHPVAATLRFTAYTFQQPRTLEVVLDDTPVTTLTLTPGQEQPIALDLTLATGNHILSFRTPEPAQATGDPNDRRLLSFGLYGVAITAK